MLIELVHVYHHDKCSTTYAEDDVEGEKIDLTQKPQSAVGSSPHANAASVCAVLPQPQGDEADHEEMELMKMTHLTGNHTSHQSFKVYSILLHIYQYSLIYLLLITCHNHFKLH